MEAGEEALLEAFPVELLQHDRFVQVAQRDRQRLLHQWVMVLPDQGKDSLLDQVSINGLLIKDVELDEAAVDATIHVFVKHGLEGTVSV